MKHALITCCMAFCATLIVGCEAKRAEPKRVKVSGSVKLDGKLLDKGRIVFDPGDGTPPASFDILDGRYEGLAPIGNMKVRLTATRVVNLKEKYKMDGPGYDQPQEENLLPPRYNTESDITREIVADGTNEYNFDLQSK